MNALSNKLKTLQSLISMLKNIKTVTFSIILSFQMLNLKAWLKLPSNLRIFDRFPKQQTSSFINKEINCFFLKQIWTRKNTKKFRLKCEKMVERISKTISWDSFKNSYFWEKFECQRMMGSSWINGQIYERD